MLVKNHCLSQIIEFESSTFMVTHTHKLSTVLSAHAGEGNYNNFYVIVINTIGNCAATVTHCQYYRIICALFYASLLTIFCQYNKCSFNGMYTH